MSVRTVLKRALALAAGLASALALMPAAQAVPSFARQTGMACEACHTIFPELTSFGRLFKLNGYVIDNLPQVKAVGSDNKESLLLNWLPPISMQFIGSFTKTKGALPDSGTAGGVAQNGSASFPEQASLFYAGRIAPKLGGFVQITYSSQSGKMAWDNTDIRYADQATVLGNSLIYGFTLNNNPTVQDVWNSTPAWTVPFDQRSSLAPVNISTQIESLSGAVAGVSAYTYWRNMVYGEVGVYRSAPSGVSNSSTGGNGPLDSSQGVNVLKNGAPYWRFAIEKQWDRTSLSVGTFGMLTDYHPAGLNAASGPTDRFRDVAFDTQFQYAGDDHLFSLQASYIKENFTLSATAPDDPIDGAGDLKTRRIGVSYYYQRRYGASLGYFSTTGSVNTHRYPGGIAVLGSASNTPDTSAATMELDFIPWQNVKLGLQYTKYYKVRGGTDNYDGAGRNASDNNTLYLFAWFAY